MCVPAWVSLRQPSNDSAGPERPVRQPEEIYETRSVYSRCTDCGLSVCIVPNCVRRRITPRRDHGIGEHLKPWGFYGEGKPSYATGIDATPGVVLSKPGDSIFQWIDVPSHDGTQHSFTYYTLRVTYAGYKSGGSASIGMKVIVADDKGEQLSEVFDHTTAGSPSGTGTFEAVVTLPAGTPVTQLGVAIGKKGDASPVIIREVALVARTDPYGPVDF